MLTLQELGLGNSTCATRSAYKFMPRTIWLLIYFAIHASLHLGSNTVNILYRHLTLTCMTQHLSALLNVSVNKHFFFHLLRKKTVTQSSSHNQLISVQPCCIPAGSEDVSLNRSQTAVYVLYLKEPGEELSGCCGEKLEWSLRFWYKYLTLCFSPLSNYIRINWLGPWGNGAVGITVLMRSALSGSLCAGGRRPNNETGWKVYSGE